MGKTFPTEYCLRMVGNPYTLSLHEPSGEFVKMLTHGPLIVPKWSPGN